MAIKKNATRRGDLAGAPPQLATVQDFLGANEPATGREHPAKTSYKNRGGIAEHARHRINLRSVAEACVDEGLDPAVEIPKALNLKRPLVKNGKQVYDENGDPVMEYVLDADVRLRTLNELLQYIQPKLKAVELKMSGSLELTGEQLDQRLAALLAKAGK